MASPCMLMCNTHLLSEKAVVPAVPRGLVVLAAADQQRGGLHAPSHQPHPPAGRNAGVQQEAAQVMLRQLGKLGVHHPLPLVVELLVGAVHLSEPAWEAAAAAETKEWGSQRVCRALCDAATVTVA